MSLQIRANHAHRTSGLCQTITVVNLTVAFTRGRLHLQPVPVAPGLVDDVRRSACETAMPESHVISPSPRRSVRIPSADEVLIVIDRILRHEVGLDFAVQPTTMFHEELALDSLGTFSLIVALEDHFKVTLPDQFADEVRTISDLATLVVRQAEHDQAEAT